MPATRLRRLLYWGETVVGLAAGVASALRGLAYLPPLAPDEVPLTLSAIGGGVPLTVYAALWLAVLPMSVAAIRYRKLWVPTVAAVAGLCVLTGVLSVLSWAINGADRGWVVAASYGLLAVLIGGLVMFASIAERQQLLIEVNPRGRS
jgi:hypothetical protein